MELDRRNEVSARPEPRLDAILELKLPRAAESVPIAAPADPEVRIKPSAPAWAQALAVDGKIESSDPKLKPEIKKAIAAYFEESPAYSNIPDQSLKNRAETQRTLLKALGVPEGEVVSVTQEGQRYAIAEPNWVRIQTERGLLQCARNGAVLFTALPLQRAELSGADQFLENARSIAELFKKSPAELRAVERGKPVSEEFAKQLSATLSKSLKSELFAQTSISVDYDKQVDAVKLTLTRKVGEHTSVWAAEVVMPCVQFENQGTSRAKTTTSGSLQRLLNAADALEIEPGLKSVAQPNSKNIALLIPKSMELSSLSAYGCEVDGSSIVRYDPKTQKTETVHELTKDQTAVFRFDSKLPGIRATILDGKKQEVGSFSFKR